MLLSDYGAAWIEERPNLRPKTTQLYRYLLRRHIATYSEAETVAEVKEAHIRRWRKQLLDSEVSAVTTAKAYRLLKAILNTAVDEGIIRRNPCRIKGAGLEKSPERPVLTIPEVFVLAEVIDSRYGALVLLGTFSSLRWGELAALRRKDIDLAVCTIRVEQQLTEMPGGRLRRSTAASTRPRSPTAHARNQIRAAAGSLAWLASRGQSLASCRHADLDDWLATGPGAWQVRAFLTWAARRGHCRPFTIPGPGRAHGTATSPDQRWALAARLLHDSSLDPTDRVAGCLLLLYGQQLSRIAALTTGQVTRRDDAVFVRLGQHDVPVPGPLGTALQELIRNGRAYTGVGSPARTRWLFPGGMPGKPITASQLGERLRALGIYAMPGRRAALTDLAAKMPAAVLADLLNLSPGTAVRWVHQAGGNWSCYAAELARERVHQT